MARTIGFIGLGAMGDGMSKNLVRAGFTVRGFDVVGAHVDRLVEAGFPLPMTAMAQQQFLAAAAMGYRRADDGAVVKVYEQLAGVDVAAAAEAAKN